MTGGSTTGENASRGCDNQSIKKENNSVTGHEFIILVKLGQSSEYIEAKASMDFQ